MRDEFLVFVDEWLALDPLNNRDASQTPFELDSFSNASLRESERLVNQAEAEFQGARDANQTGDDYILATVFFATVLFFTGVFSKFTVLNVRSFILLLALGGFGIGLWRMLTLPFHSSVCAPSHSGVPRLTSTLCPTTRLMTWSDAGGRAGGPSRSWTGRPASGAVTSGVLAGGGQADDGAAAAGPGWTSWSHFTRTC